MRIREESVPATISDVDDRILRHRGMQSLARAQQKFIRESDSDSGDSIVKYDIRFSQRISNKLEEINSEI